MLKDNSLYLMPEDWEEISTYLFTERGMSLSSGSVGSIKSRFKIMVQAFSSTPLNRNTFNEFIKHYQLAGNKNTYINGYIKLVKHIDKYYSLNFDDYKLQFVERTYLKENRNPIVDTLTWEEMEHIALTDVEYSRDPEIKNLRAKALVLFISQTGCRINEALNLVWEDVFENKVVFRLTKSGEDRLVPIAPTLKKELDKLPKQSKYVWGGEMDPNKPWDDTVASHHIKTRAAKAGITKRIYPHIFRHSFITEMLKSGCEIAFVSRIVGHEDFKTTSRYTHFVLTDLENALYSHHPMLKEGMTFSLLKGKLEEIVKKWVDPTRFQLATLEDEGSLTIKVNIKNVMGFMAHE